MRKKLARARELSSLLLRTYAARARRRGPIGARRAAAWNTVFRRSRLPQLSAAVDTLRGFDVSLNVVLTAPRLAGQIEFEYGTLVDWIPSWAGLRVLDIGTGRSTLPRWMASQGARVTTLEYPNPVE